MRSIRPRTYVNTILVTLLGVIVAYGQAPVPEPVPFVNQPLIPTSVAPGSGAFSLTVIGTGFTAGSIVHWNCNPLDTTLTTSNIVVAAILAADVATAGTASVTVVNPTPGGGTSNVVYFPVATPLDSVSMNRTDYTVGTQPRDVRSGDLDGDGKAEVAVVTAGGSVFIVRGGTLIKGDIPGKVRSAPALADVDNDGFLEVLAGGEGLHVVRHNGVAQAGSPFNPPIKDQALEVVAPPLVADLDGDAKFDILYAAGDYLYGVRGDGTPLPGFPVAAIGGLIASPLVEDLDHDGNLDLVAITSEGVLSRWDLLRVNGALKGKEVAWGQAGGGPGNRNAPLFSNKPPSPPPSDELMPSDRVYCYPNPVEGNTARLRFYVDRAARVEVTVFNTAADLVGSMALEAATPLAENEILWDTTGYAPGLYVCRVEAIDSEGRREVRLVKAAIK